MVNTQPTKADGVRLRDSTDAVGGIPDSLFKAM